MNAVEYCLLHGLKVAGPGHPALLSAGEALSYGALEQRVSQFAVGLREAGVCPGDRVGMLMLDTPDIVAVYPATMAVGAIAVAAHASAAGAARECLAQTLPGYKQPRRFEVIADLPRTATGKVQSHKLSERLRRDHY